VDLYLGEEDGLELLKKAKYESGGVKFVILTSSLKKEDFIRAEEAGADGVHTQGCFFGRYLVCNQCCFKEVKSLSTLI